MLRLGPIDRRSHERTSDPSSLHRLGHAGVHEHDPATIDLVDELGLLPVLVDDETVPFAIFEDSRENSVLLAQFDLGSL